LISFVVSRQIFTHIQEHIGVSADDGHYVATIRTEEEDLWTKISDSNVYSTTDFKSKEMSVEQNGKLFFYKKKPVVCMFNLKLQDSDLFTLKPKKWLNDEVNLMVINLGDHQLLFTIDTSRKIECNELQ
jgi:hypothetical protein